MPEYPPGKYRATVESQGFDRNTNGKEYFGLVIRPTVHFTDSSASETEFVNNPFPRTVKFWLTSDKSIAYSRKKLMHATAWDGTSWATLDPELPNHLNLTGVEIEVINEHSAGSSNPDKMYDNFDVQLPRQAEMKNDSGIAKRLDRLGGTVPAAAPAPAPAAAPAPPTTTTTTVIGDDVPF